MKQQNFKLNRIAVVAIVLLILIFLGRSTFIIADLLFANEPLFYKFQTCPSIKNGVLITHVVSYATIIASSFFIYWVFTRVVNKKLWKQTDARIVGGLFGVILLGFYVITMMDIIADDFLLSSSKIGCPIFINMVTSSYYLKYALGEFLFNPVYLVLVLLMTLIASFLRYSYGFKADSDSIV